MEIKDTKGLQVDVTFDLPYCLYLPDDSYEVRLNNLTAKIALSRVEQEKLDPRLHITGQAGVEFIKDRQGLLRYSRVTVSIPGKDLLEAEIRERVRLGKLQTDNGQITITISSDELGEQYDQGAIDTATALVNRLASVYRHVNDEYHIRPLSHKDIHHLEVQWFQDDQLYAGGSYSSFGTGIGLMPIGFDSGKLEEFRRYLAASGEIPTTFELFQDAKDHLDREDYRLAVIDARTALELLVDELLLDYFDKENLSLKESCKILDVKPEPDLRIEEAIQRASISRKLKHGIRSATGIDLPQHYSELWTKWLKAKKLREDGAHRGRKLERDDAITAVGAMGDIMTIIFND